MKRKSIPKRKEGEKREKKIAEWTVKIKMDQSNVINSNL